MDVGTTGNYDSISLWLRTTLERELPYRHQARPWAGVQYVRVTVLKDPKPKWATGNGTKGWLCSKWKMQRGSSLTLESGYSCFIRLDKRVWMDKYDSLDSSSSEATQGEPRTNHHMRDSKEKGDG